MRKPKRKRSRIQESVDLDYLDFGHQFPEEGIQINVGGQTIQTFSADEDLEL